MTLISKIENLISIIREDINTRRQRPEERRLGGFPASEGSGGDFTSMAFAGAIGASIAKGMSEGGGGYGAVPASEPHPIFGTRQASPQWLGAMDDYIKDWFNELAEEAIDGLDDAFHMGPDIVKDMADKYSQMEGPERYAFKNRLLEELANRTGHMGTEEQRDYIKDLFSWDKVPPDLEISPADREHVKDLQQKHDLRSAFDGMTAGFTNILGGTEKLLDNLSPIADALGNRRVPGTTASWFNNLLLGNTDGAAGAGGAAGAVGAAGAGGAAGSSILGKGMGMIKPLGALLGASAVIREINQTAMLPPQGQTGLDQARAQAQGSVHRSGALRETGKAAHQFKNAFLGLGEISTAFASANRAW